MQGIAFKAISIIIALSFVMILNSQTFAAGCMGCHQGEISTTANELIDKSEYTQRQDNQKQNSAQEVSEEEVLSS